MPTLNITLPKLHSGGQRQIRECSARFIVIDAGRRWGKTLLGVALCTEAGLEGKRAWWVGPTYPTASVGWRPLMHLAYQIPGALPVKTTRTVHYPNGGWVQVKSAEKPEGLRGEGLDLVIIDEVAHMPKFEEAWSQALRPALSDRKGDAIFISTPKGFNHFYELFRKAGGDPSITGLAGREGDWAAFRHPTWDNPFIDPEEIEDARKLLPSLIFRQEYGAEFVQLAGALFQRDWFHTIEKAPANIRYVRFWDLAASIKTSADYTAGAKEGLTSKGLLVTADVVHGRWEWPDVVSVIRETALMDGPAVTQGIEAAGVQRGMYQTLIREPKLVGIPFKQVEVTTDKLTRALPWLARAEQGMKAFVRGPWNKATLDQICAFPETEHDDIVDAISGAVQMLSQAPAFYY